MTFSEQDAKGSMKQVNVRLKEGKSCARSISVKKRRSAGKWLMYVMYVRTYEEEEETMKTTSKRKS